MNSRAPQCCTWRSGVQPSHRPLHRAARQGAATTLRSVGQAPPRGKVKIYLVARRSQAGACKAEYFYRHGLREPGPSSSTGSYEYMSPLLTDDLRDDESPAADRLAATTIARHIIEAVTPSVDGGRYPVKRIVGEPCVVEGDIFRDGHDVIRAVIKWRREKDAGFTEAPMTLFDNDRWRGEFPLEENTRYVFTIEAWTDRFASWLADFTKKASAGRDVASDLLEGIAIVEAIRRRAKGSDIAVLSKTLERMHHVPAVDASSAIEIVSIPELAEIAVRAGERADANTCQTLFEVIADRPRARFGAWYEMFPRSQGMNPGKATTLREAERRLPEISAMGFDVVYLTPIQPIGHTNRKGPNNKLASDGAGPGSPWAIGSADGGHTAIEPSLGTLDDFDHFAATTAKLGME